MKRIVFVVMLTLVSGPSFLERAQQTRGIFDHFGDTCCNDEKARLDNFVNQLRNEPNATGFIIFYGGRRYRPFCSSKRTVLPRRGEAQARASRLKPYILDGWPGFDGKRIVVIDGGYRESWEAELWIVPPGEQPPNPTPTVKPNAIKLRRGRARARDYHCEV
jgi:hypothetical protein